MSKKATFQEFVIFVQFGRFKSDDGSTVEYQSLLVMPDEDVERKGAENTSYGRKPSKEQIDPVYRESVYKAFREGGVGLYDVEYDKTQSGFVVVGIKKAAEGGSQGKRG